MIHPKRPYIKKLTHLNIYKKSYSYSTTKAQSAQIQTVYNHLIRHHDQLPAHDDSGATTDKTDLRYRHSCPTLVISRDESELLRVIPPISTYNFAGRQLSIAVGVAR